MEVDEGREFEQGLNPDGSGTAEKGEEGSDADTNYAMIEVYKDYLECGVVNPKEEIGMEIKSLLYSHGCTVIYRRYKYTAQLSEQNYIVFLNRVGF